MKRKLTFVLAAFLFIGGCDVNCGKGPTTNWEIESVKLTNQVFDGQEWNTNITEALQDSLQTYLEFDFDQVAILSFSWNKLYALDCHDPKNLLNSIRSIELTTNFEVNELYPIESSITEIATWNGIPFNEIIGHPDYQGRGLLDVSGGWVELEQMPEKGSEFSITIVVLDDGSELTATTNQVTIL